MTVRFVPVIAVSFLLTSAAAAQDSGPAPAEKAINGGAASAAPDVSPATAPAVVPSAVDTSNDYRIGPGDVLEVWVFDQRELQKPRVPVRPDGKISFPFVNDIVAAGRSAVELGAEITERLKNGQFLENPVVTVTLVEIRSARATVSGAVRMPNTYEVRPGDTVLDLIAKAQFFTDFANRKDIILIRGKDGQRLKLNYDRMRDGKQANPVVENGDIILVGD